MIRQILHLIIITGLFLFFQTPQILADQQDFLKISKEDLAMRKEEFAKLIKASKEVSKYMAPEDSKRVLYALEKTYLGIPLPDSIFSVDSSKNDKGHITITIITKDDDLKGEFAFLSTYDFVSTSNMVAKTIVFNNRIEMTDFCKGIIISCEILSYLEKTENKISDIDSIKLIVKSQQDILNNYGKEKYKSLLENYVKKIATNLIGNKSSSAIVEEMIPNTKIYFYPSDLDEIFGKAKSSEEIRIRFILFWTHCYYSLIDEIAKYGKNDPKFAEKLKHIYILKMFGNDESHDTPPQNPI